MGQAIRLLLAILVAGLVPACDGGGGGGGALSAEPPRWPPLNTPLAAAAGSQQNPRIVSDGAFGAIVVWQDNRWGVGWDVYAQRVSGAGVPQWTPGGIAICTVSGDQSNPRIAPDGSGGAIILWQDSRGGGTFDLYAQRVSAAGALLWAPTGVPVCVALNDQVDPQIVPDGQGGAEATWTDGRTPGIWKIYAQRIDGSGAAQWTTDGVLVCSKSCALPQLDADGSGGAVIVWQDYRPGTTSDIYAQRVDGTGALLWTVDGVAVCTAADYQLSPQLVSDGAGGAFFVWSDARVSQAQADIYAQHVSGTGTVLWAMDGLAVCTAASVQNWPQIIGDGSGGAILAWQDNRAANSPHVYAQRVTGAGAPLWTADGAPICAAVDFQSLAQLAPDGAGGAVLVWEAWSLSQFDIGAQRVNSSGAAQWAVDGVLLCTAAGNQVTPRIVANAPGRWIAVWEDQRPGAPPDIYAQGVDDQGN